MMAPGFDTQKLALLPEAAIRWVLSDERIQVLNIGVSLRSDIGQNVHTVCGNVKLRLADRELLADFSRRVYESDAAKKMRVV